MLRESVARFPLLIFFVLLLLAGCRGAAEEFPMIEATIADIHRAVEAGELTFVELTQTYLDRIERYDQPTGLNAIVVVNPDALERARELDEEFQRTGVLRPLHGIPIIVKDNYDTHDLQTAAGSAALEGSLPPDDAFQVRRIREAGAIVLAKSNMAEWAFSPYVTESSIAGVTRNPYDLERVPAGSSGGTAAAVAANLGAAGLGTDTGNSIRGPASHNALVGIRSTIGATSRDGIVPLYLRNDIGGPLCRTVEDTARVFGAIAGVDPADPVTQHGRGLVHDDYTQFLDADGLQGATLGVFRQLSNTDTADPEVLALEIVDPFQVADFEELSEGVWCDVFAHDVNEYLKSLGPGAPYRTIQEIFDAGIYADSVKRRFAAALEEGTTPPEERDPPCLDAYRDPKRIALREAIVAAMEEHGVEAIIFPTWNNPPRKIGDMESPDGNNSYQISPPTGMPAITVPMGFAPGNLPTGLQMTARMFEEGALFRLAYAYEQGTTHRRPPERFGGEAAH